MKTCVWCGKPIYQYDVYRGATDELGVVRYWHYPSCWNSNYRSFFTITDYNTLSASGDELTRR